MGKVPDANWIVISLLLFIVGRMLWSWFVSGRVQKEPPYISNEKCEEYRNRCCIGQTKKDVIETNIRVEGIERQVREDKADLKEMRKEFNEMNIRITNMDGNIELIKNTIVEAMNNGKSK